MIKLAIMSDLHVGLTARSKDLCPKPSNTQKNRLARYNRKIEDAFKHNFIKFVKDKNNEISADYLVLPGDITSEAKPPEVQLASEFILQAADALGVAPHKIVFAPGNHDVDWSVIDPSDNTGVRWRQRYTPIGDEGFHFKKLVDKGEGDVFSTPYFVAWNFDDLLVVSYNSASHDSPIHKDAAHHGLADPDHIKKLRDYLTGIGTADTRFRIFIVHHHVHDFSMPIPRDPDFSLMTNAESLLTLLHESCFDMLIHGHRHHPRFETHSTQTYPHLPILCSGSFSVEIDTRWTGTIDNQFHLVTINERSGCENQITGKITSWAYNHSRKWFPSEESTSGIHHIIPFGSYVMPHELDARLEPFIRHWLTNHEYILWRHIVENFPELEHLPLSSAIAAFDRIASLFNRKSMHKTLNDLILY